MESSSLNNSSLEPKVQQEQKVEEARYELRNSSNEVICMLSITFDYLLPKGSRIKKEGKELKHILSISLEASGVSFDILTLPDIPRAPIMILDQDYHYDDVTDEVFIPEPKTLVDLYIALHELGHAAQNREDVYKNASPYHGVSHVRSFAGAIALARSERVKIPLPDDLLKKLENFSIEYNDSLKQMKDGDQHDPENENNIRNQNASDNFFDALEGDQRKIDLAWRIVNDVPTMIFERNATLRSILWIREVSKKLGASLNFKVKTEELDFLKALRETIRGEHSLTEETVEMFVKICNEDDITARKIINLALSTHEVNISPSRFLTK